MHAIAAWQGCIPYTLTADHFYVVLTTVVSQLQVRELSELPSLQSLALPAALFCSRCCPEKHYPGLRASLETLAAKPHLARLDLLTLPAATLGKRGVRLACSDFCVVHLCGHCNWLAAGWHCEDPCIS